MEAGRGCSFSHAPRPAQQKTKHMNLTPGPLDSQGPDDSDHGKDAPPEFGTGEIRTTDGRGPLLSEEKLAGLFGLSLGSGDPAAASKKCAAEGPDIVEEANRDPELTVAPPGPADSRPS